MDLFIVSGCNGAGKTTASFSILPEILDCREFINADAIAAGLSDEILIFDNSEGKHELIAEKADDSKIIVINQLKYNNLFNYYDVKRKN